MMSLAHIEAASREAARKAAKAKSLPFVVEAEDLAAFKARRTSLPFPNLGSHVPPGWELTRTLFVDSSGFGSESEPALTVERFLEELQVGMGYAITQIGQFQVYVGEYKRAN